MCKMQFRSSFTLGLASAVKLFLMVYANRSWFGFFYFSLLLILIEKGLFSLFPYGKYS